MFPDWVRQDIQELGKAKWSASVLGVTALALGASGGFWVGKTLYEERIAVLNEKLELQEAEAKRSSGLMSAAGDGIVGWGGGADNPCDIRVDGSVLQEFRTKLNAVLICGVGRSQIDRLADTLISKSTAFNIDTGTFTIQAPAATKAITALLASVASGAPRRGATGRVNYTMWYELALLPKSVAVEDIRSLADVERVGGIRHSNRATQYIRSIVAR